FRIFIVIFAIFNCALTIFSFSNVRERVKVASSKRVTLKQSVRAMNKNWPWFILVAGNLLFWIAQQNRQSGMVYYFTYYFHNKGLVTFFNSISLIQVLAILLIPLMNKHMTKSHIWALGFAGAVFGQVIIMVSGHSMAGAIAGWVIGMLGSGIAVSMPFAMLGSAVDFGEWKSGINAAGLLTTIGSAFCMSMGQGIAGYINGAFLSAFGYVANATQTAHALTGISLDFNGATIVIYALAIIPALMYGKYEKMEDKIITDLSKTRL
ncbi:MFS transporter, partial [Paucilactobacillus oligofermentans]